MKLYYERPCFSCSATGGVGYAGACHVCKGMGYVFAEASHQMLVDALITSFKEKIKKLLHI